MDNIVVKTVLKKISNLTINESNKNLHLLLAVSGGADSIAMLHSINLCKAKLNFKISVITINHNIREEKETLGDAQFVLNFCKELNPEIKCYLVEFKKHEVYETAKIRNNGTEEAARFLRYQAFKQKVKEINANYILTAHTKNDYYETILMRIFQGANPEALQGITEKRGIFFKPMLSLNRNEIENYLTEQNIKWKEDKTNYETIFLRNKIRHILTPALKKTFNGWQNGIDKTIKKINMQNNFVNLEYEKKIKTENWIIEKNKKTENKTDQNDDLILKYNFKFFKKLHKIIKFKFIQDGINILNSNANKNNRKRIPYSVFNDFLKISNKNKKIISNKFCLEKKDEYLYFSKLKNINNTKKLPQSYILWIENSGEFKTPAGTFLINNEGNNFFINLKNSTMKKIGPFKKPFCIRSKILGDTIKLKNGNSTQLKKIINKWKLDEQEREILPIVEEKGVVTAIIGKVFKKENISNKI